MPQRCGVPVNSTRLTVPAPRGCHNLRWHSQESCGPHTGRHTAWSLELKASVGEGGWGHRARGSARPILPHTEALGEVHLRAFPRTQSSCSHSSRTGTAHRPHRVLLRAGEHIQTPLFEGSIQKVSQPPSSGAWLLSLVRWALPLTSGALQLAAARGLGRCQTGQAEHRAVPSPWRTVLRAPLE